LLFADVKVGRENVPLMVESIPLTGEFIPLMGECVPPCKKSIDKRVIE